MSCPFCTKKEIDYHWSGADVSFYPPGLPEKAIILVEDKPYPIFEIRVCDVCSTPWFVDYFFADHPPLLIFGKALVNTNAANAALERIKQETVDTTEIQNYIKGLGL